MSNPTRKQRVYDALEQAGARGATTAELCSPFVGGVRFSARIFELRAEGCVIRERYEREGSHRYFLLSEAKELAA